MSRMERLKEYAAMKGPAGEAYSKENLNYWSDRATANSKCPPRAKGGEMNLPSTGKSMATRDTSMKPYSSRKSGDAVIDQAKADKNSVGSSYMRGIRRDA